MKKTRIRVLRGNIKLGGEMHVAGDEPLVPAEEADAAIEADEKANRKPRIAKKERKREAKRAVH